MSEQPDDRNEPRPTNAEAYLIAAHTRIAEEMRRGMEELLRVTRTAEGFGISQENDA